MGNLTGIPMIGEEAQYFMYGDDEFLFQNSKVQTLHFEALKPRGWGCGVGGETITLLFMRARNPQNVSCFAKYSARVTTTATTEGPRIHDVCNISGFCDPLG